MQPCDFALIEFGALIDEDASFVWEHVEPCQLPLPLQSQVEHACCFSESMHGAPLAPRTSGQHIIPIS